MKQRNADKKYQKRVAGYELSKRESKNSTGLNKPGSRKRD